MNPIYLKQKFLRGDELLSPANLERNVVLLKYKQVALTQIPIKVKCIISCHGQLVPDIKGFYFSLRFTIMLLMSCRMIVNTKLKTPTRRIVVMGKLVVLHDKPRKVRVFSDKC